jgi:hypothetical protein
MLRWWGVVRTSKRLEDIVRCATLPLMTTCIQLLRLDWTLNDMGDGRSSPFDLLSVAFGEASDERQDQDKERYTAQNATDDNPDMTCLR